MGKLKGTFIQFILLSSYMYICHKPHWYALKIMEKVQPYNCFCHGRLTLFCKIFAPDRKEIATMTVPSSYSLGSAPCPWGSGWRHAALVDATPALFPAGSVVVAAAAAPDGAPSQRVPAAASWPGALAGAEKSGAHISMNRSNCRIKEAFKNVRCFLFCCSKNSTLQLDVFL